MLRIFDTCYHHGDGFEESSCLSIFAILMLVVVMVVGITYAAYLFIHATGISEIAGIHISKNLILASKSAQGNLYTNTEKGIKDWIIYQDRGNNFEVKYPNDWKVRENAGNLFSVGLSNMQHEGRESLAMVVNIGKLNLEKGDDFAKVVAGNEPELETSALQEQELNGKIVVHTKKHHEESGMFGDTYYWKMDGNVLYLQAHYYNAISTDSEELFNKIFEEFKII